MAHRSGYTLIELIVVIGIMSLLVGLLLPAVQKVRHAADSLRCRNNLKQASLACHQYHDTAGALPAAFRTGGSSLPYLQWRTLIGPYLEQDAAFAAAQADYARAPNAFKASPPHSGMDRLVPVFACPADWRTQTAWTVRAKGQTWHVTHSSYFANSGSRTKLRDGVVYANSKTRLELVRDGTSSTLLFGERPPSADLRFGWLYASVGQDGAGSLDSVIGVRDPNTAFESDYRPCGLGPFAFAGRRVEDPCSAFQYWSLHPCGANFAFCDGSVRFLTYSADSILPALATRAGGEVFDMP